MAAPVPTSFRVISIGTLAAHSLWGESLDVRTGHATTTLIEAGASKILVDPSLPTSALLARLGERTNIKPASITHVFLTSWTRLHVRALAAFEDAIWLAHEPERDAALVIARTLLDEAEDGDDAELQAFAQRELTLLENVRAADDRIAPGVDLFPLPGVSAGACGLLLPQPNRTVLIAGDAVATVEHLEQGKVLPFCHDVETAMESFREAIEIADLIVPGRDNVVVNPLRR